jgi:hypothetical protein
MALAAASMSAKVFGLTAGVWAMTEAVSVSIFSTALQHGQVTSKLDGFLAIYANHTPKSMGRGNDDTAVLAFSSAGKLKLIFTPKLMISLNLLHTYNVVRTYP